MAKMVLTAIMVRAWSIRRAAAREMCVSAGTVLMSECLRLSWQEYHLSILANRLGGYGKAVAYQWNNLPAHGDDDKRDNGERQAGYCRAITIKRMKYDIGTSATQYDGDERQIWQGYITLDETAYRPRLDADTIDAIANDLWIRVAARVSDVDAFDVAQNARMLDGKRPLTLSSIMWYSARDAVAAFNRRELKHVAASVRVRTMPDGTTREYIDTVDGGRPSDDIRRTEAKALSRIACNWSTVIASAKDATDKLILEMRRDGLTSVQIAGTLDISHQAVNKRIKKCLARYLAD